MSEPMRRETREKLSKGVTYAEDALYLAAGVVLAVTSALILVASARMVLDAVRTDEVLGVTIQVLDSILLVLLIVEIMHTIRVSIVEHALLAEPFLVVALIAGVRRVLILTAEAAEFLPDHPELFDRILLEMLVLIALFVVVVGALVMLRRLGRAEGSGPEGATK